MKLLKLENLVIVAYAVIVGLCFAFLDPNQRRTGDIFFGLIGMSIYVLSFRYWLRIGPASSRIFLAIHALVIVLLLCVPAFEAAGLILPVPLLLAAIFFAQRERAKGLSQWLAANHYSNVPIISAALLEKMGAQNDWRCFANTIALADGRTVPFVFWQGDMTGSTFVNSRPTKVKNAVIGFSFLQSDVGESFMQALEAMALAKLNWFQRLRPSNQSARPYLVERMADGSFVAAWNGWHMPSVVDEKLNLFRRLLAQSSHESIAISQTSPA